MEYIYFIDRTMTTTEDEGSDFDTSEYETGMFHPQLFCNFYWGGMGWIILKGFPIYSIIELIIIFLYSSWESCTLCILQSWSHANSEISAHGKKKVALLISILFFIFKTLFQQTIPTFNSSLFHYSSVI